MIDLQVQTNFTGLRKFNDTIRANLAIGVQLAAVEVQTIAKEEVEILDAYDTYALQESIYISWLGGSDYEDRCNEAADAALNNPTNWESIRAWKLQLPGGIPPHYNSRQSVNGGIAGPGYLELDPKVVSHSRYDAYVAVAASHGKYVENGYISWFNNWVPPRPFWQATADRARPVVLGVLYEALRGWAPNVGGTP